MKRLIPSRETIRIINRYKPLSKQQQIKWTQEYKKRKSSKAAQVLINAVSKLFASQIKRNQTKFVKTLPEATYDDIFNQMVLSFLQGMPTYDPTKSSLTTRAMFTSMPITKNPYQVMGNRFAAAHRPANIDKPVGDTDMTIGGLIPDKGGSPQDNYYVRKNKGRIMRAIKKLDKQDQQIALSLYGFIPIKKQWQTKTGKINPSSIARGEGVHPDRMRRRIGKIEDILRSQLRQNKLSRYQKINKIDRLIKQLQS